MVDFGFRKTLYEKFYPFKYGFSSGEKPLKKRAEKGHFQKEFQCFLGK